MLARSHVQRRDFCENYFGAEWTDPLEHHLTINSGRLGPLAVDVVAWITERHWSPLPTIRSPLPPPSSIS